MAPLDVTPQAPRPLELTDANVSPPDTATGVRLLVVVPVPSWPKALSPQQYATPFGVTPQVEYFSPALTAANVSPPDTATGVALLVVVPLPSSPYRAGSRSRRSV